MPQASRKLTDWQILVICILALILPVIWIEWRVLQATHGTLAYPLDDTFIHMAVARNLAFNHFWGIAGHAFASTSSSPFYTLLLAGLFLVFGFHVALPLIINVLAGIAVLVAMQRWLTRQGVAATDQLIILIFVNFLTPLPLLVISGMEHSFQLLFTFLFLTSFAAEFESPAATTARAVSMPSAVRPRSPWPLYLFGALMVSTRYECLPILALACLVLLICRRWKTGISLALIGVLPITLFGLYSMSKGSYFMPNSVLLKAALPHTPRAIAHFFLEDIWYRMFFSPNEFNLLAAQRLLILLPVFYILFISQLRLNRPYRYILLVLMAAVLAHVAFTYPSNFPRYESYLVGLSVFMMGLLIAKYRRQIPLGNIKGAKWVAALLVIVLFVPLFIRSEKTFQKSKQYCLNIYEQQYQMSQFVHDYYDTTPLAFNDIGAVSFYSKGDKLDLWGLASYEVAKARRQHYWTPAFADSLVEKHAFLPGNRRMRASSNAAAWPWPLRSWPGPTGPACHLWSRRRRRRYR